MHTSAAALKAPAKGKASRTNKNLTLLSLKTLASLAVKPRAPTSKNLPPTRTRLAKTIPSRASLARTRRVKTRASNPREESKKPTPNAARKPETTPIESNRKLNASPAASQNNTTTTLPKKLFTITLTTARFSRVTRRQRAANANGVKKSVERRNRNAIVVKSSKRVGGLNKASHAARVVKYFASPAAQARVA